LRLAVQAFGVDDPRRFSTGSLLKTQTELTPTALPEPPADTGKRRWRAGTLSYSLGGLVVLFFWLLWGDFSLQLKERAVPPALQRLLDMFHASNTVVGLLISALPPALVIVIVPIVCYRSDRHRGRWGRRIPFLLVVTPLAVVSMAGLAFSPVLGRRIAHLFGSTNENTTIILSFGLFWAMFELSSIICQHILSGLINDVVPREMLGRFYGMFRILSLSAGMLFHYFLMGKVATDYVPIFLGMAALYGVSFTLMCLRVKEGAYPAPLDAVQLPIEAAPALGELVSTGAQPEAGPVIPYASPSTKSGQFLNATGTYLSESFGNPYYLWFFASNALAIMAFSPINTFSLYFAQSVGMSDTGYGHYSALQLFCSLLQAYPIGWLADKIHPLRATIIATLLYTLATLWAFFFVHTAPLFAAAHVICGTIAGFWLTATAPLGPAVLPKAKYAQFASAAGICAAVGTMIVGPTCGWFIDAMHREYRFIYLWACVLMFSSLIVTLVLYRGFLKLGGTRHYAPPES
jgi:MFS family permease